MNYSNDIEKYYSASLIDTFLSNSNKAYNSGKEAKLVFVKNWEEIMQRIKNITGIVKVRDVSYSSYPDTGKATIGINSELSQGITLNINYRCKKIGFYYCDYNHKSNTPIKDQNTALQSHLSYFPFNEVQQSVAREIFELTKQHFTGFDLFNNFFASKKAKQVIIDMTIVNESDYFQVFFDNNMDCII